jgi:hypothetical protein
LSTAPLKEIAPADAVAEIRDLLKETEVFSADEIEWVESVLTRPDGIDGFETITGSFGQLQKNGEADLIGACRRYVEDKPTMTAVERFAGRQKLRALLHSKRVSFYVQKRVLILAPQRKQHPKYYAPNLHGFPGAGQSNSCAILTCYGLDYVDARTTLIKQALADPQATHVFFCDDDVLIPKDTIKRLLDYSLPIVSGVYPKKAATLEPGTTASGADAELIFGQKEVPIQVGNFDPVAVSCVQGGMLLINLDVFRRMPEPWFQMLLGPDGRVVVGEDSFFCQRTAELGIKTYAVPGIIGVHVNCENGDCYGPPEIVDPTTMRIRPEVAPFYQAWPEDLNVRDLVAPDVRDYFGKNKELAAKGIK